MGKIVSFSAAARQALLRSGEELMRTDTCGMDEAQLRRLLEDVAEMIRRLDEAEPGDMQSDAYEEWAEVHEGVEDLQDEIFDLLDKLT